MNNFNTDLIQILAQGLDINEFFRQQLEIADLLEKMYGNHYSPTTISNISKVMKNEIEAYHNRKIKKDFVVLYCDATYLPVRRDSVAKESLHVIISIDPNGNKEILDYSLFPEESSNNYKEMLINLKSRGLENVLLFVSDGLVGLKEAVTDIFPKSKHQTCWTHLMRNKENKVRAKDKLEVANDAKLIYTSDNIETAEKRLTEFLSKWSIK